MTFRSFIRGLLWTLVGLFVVLHLAGGWYFSDVLIADAFVPDPDPIEIPTDPELGEFTIEEVTYQSALGGFDAWYLPASSSTWVIHVHGKGATPAEGAALFEPIQEAGFPQLAITYRNDAGQPLDPSGHYRYGVSEWEEISGAVSYALSNGADGVVLYGFSTGGAHVLNYAYRHALGAIRGIILDSGNADMNSTVAHGASQRDVPVLPMKVPPTLTWVAKFVTSLRIGVNWQLLDYIDGAANGIRVPVLALHGDADDTVPVSQSVRLAEASPDHVRLVVFPGSGHVDSLEDDRERYLDEVLSFLRRID